MACVFPVPLRGQARVVVDNSGTCVVVAGVGGNSVLSGKAPRGFLEELQTLASPA